MPSLSPLLVSLIVAASVNPSGTSAAGPAAADRATAVRATNVERAKMGLLPRRAVRSRVAYLDGATGPGKAAMMSPALDAQPVVAVEGDAVQVVAAADLAPSPPAAPVVVASDAPSANDPAEKVVQAAKDDAPVEDAAPAREAAATTVANDAAPAAPGKDAAAPTVVAKGTAPARDAGPKEDAAPAASPAVAVAIPPDARPAAQAPSPARAAAPSPAQPETSPAIAKADRAAPRVAVLERVIDQAGEIVVRVVGQGEKVVGEKVVCSLDDLPVLSSTRAEDGNVVQLVQDDWGPIEVRRDPVGRFLSAKPVEGRTGTTD